MSVGVLFWPPLIVVACLCIFITAQLYECHVTAEIQNSFWIMHDDIDKSQYSEQPHRNVWNSADKHIEFY